MSYNTLRRSLLLVGLIIVVVIGVVLSSLSGCSGGAQVGVSPTVSPDVGASMEAVPTARSQPVQDALSTPEIPPNTPAMQVQVLGEADLSLVVGVSRSTLNFRDVLIMRGDGSLLRCMIIIGKAFELGVPDSIAQTCEPQ